MCPLEAISSEAQHVIDLEEPAGDMYNKLKAEVVKQSSGSSANRIRPELVYKKFEETPKMEIYDEHLTLCRSNNAALDLDAVDCG